MLIVSAERELLIQQGLEDLDIQEDQNAVFVCEISVEDVPGEWYKNGERIQPTSTIKIRQEGQLQKSQTLNSQGLQTSAEDRCSTWSDVIERRKKWWAWILSWHFYSSFRDQTLSSYVQRASRGLRRDQVCRQTCWICGLPGGGRYTQSIYVTNEERIKAFLFVTQLVKGVSICGTCWTKCGNMPVKSFIKSEFI